MGMNADLASVHSKAENDFVFGLNPQLDKLRWIGARRMRESEPPNPTPEEFNFQFVDGTPFDILDDPAYAMCNPMFLDNRCLYQTGEPNDLDPGENCIVQGSRDPNALVLPGQWNDASCGFTRQFVCKRASKFALPHSGTAAFFFWVCRGQGKQWAAAHASRLLSWRGRTCRNARPFAPTHTHTRSLQPLPSLPY